MKPILFNTEMVRALLEDRKTATRRVVKLKYSNTHLEMQTNKYGTRLIEIQNEEPGVTIVKNPDGTTTHRLLAAIEKEPPYHPGNILYVRETWSPVHVTPKRYIYKADVDAGRGEGAGLPLRWHPSIHMPKEAARIFLRVTGVRVERLQDITEAGAVLEGCMKWYEGTKLETEARSHFCNLWDSTIKPADLPLYGWEADPWVWVIEFERISKKEEKVIHEIQGHCL